MPNGNAPITAEAFEAQFLELRESLRSYLFRLTTHRQNTEDLTQDTYLKARNHLSGFAGKSSLRTWVFSIATNLARDHFRTRHRWREDTQDRCREATQASPAKVTRMRTLVSSSPAEQYEFHEHIDYCFTCLAKTLEIERQLVLILKDVYAFKISEIMEILGLSEGKVKHALAGARQLMTDIFDRRCTLVSKTGVCYQCSEMSGFVNPKQEAREQALRLLLVREAEAGASKEDLLALRAELVRGVDPLRAPGAAVHAYLLELMAETENG